uniref:Ras-associating domain-containing protein n=1 Tax=Steinernema glaseri TaxID=37863 RepID=A0A1I8A317_9BILA
MGDTRMSTSMEQPLLRNMRKMTSDKSLTSAKKRKKVQKQRTIDECWDRSMLEASTSSAYRASDTSTSALSVAPVKNTSTSALSVAPIKSEQRNGCRQSNTSVVSHVPLKREQKHGSSKCTTVVEKRRRTYPPDIPAPCSGFNDTALGVPQRPSLLLDMKIESEETASLVPFVPRPFTVTDQFREIKISSLAEVLKLKKFWFKPETRTILPVISECSKDIGTAADQWSLLIYVSDESAERVEMVLQDELLVELLGFTVQHCKRSCAPSPGHLQEAGPCLHRGILPASEDHSRREEG